MAAATAEQIAKAPKAALHEHLDGGLHPATIVEIAHEIGHDLPAPDAESLGVWFEESSSSGSLERYLETFIHTVAAMQRPQDLARVARESVLDLASDNVVYAELRWAPEQHLSAGLTLQETVEAVQSGIDEGRAEAAAQGTPIVIGATAERDLALALAARTRTSRSTPVRHLAFRRSGRRSSAVAQRGWVMVYA